MHKYFLNKLKQNIQHLCHAPNEKQIDEAAIPCHVFWGFSWTLWSWGSGSSGGEWGWDKTRWRPASGRCVSGRGIFPASLCPWTERTLHSVCDDEVPPGWTVWLSVHCMPPIRLLNWHISYWPQIFFLLWKKKNHVCSATGIFLWHTCISLESFSK